MSHVVLADAQFGVVRNLRPSPNFETIYTGQPADTPIYFYQRARQLDPQAEASRPGYDPDLIRGLAVPVGAKVQIWVPNVQWISDDSPVTIESYRWTVIWRLRNVFDYRVSRIPWHLPRGRGPNDTSSGTPEPRVVIPAAYNTLTYDRAEPTTPSATVDANRATSSVRAQDLLFGAIAVGQPLLDAGGTLGVVQQGVLDPAVAVEANTPTFLVHEMRAQGDELLLAAWRESADPTPNWGFASGGFPNNADFIFSRLLGNGTGQVFPDVGVYVMVGSAP